MIEQISIENFKLFHACTTFAGLKKVNILTGVNGRGKSSFLQSLLVPAQSVLNNMHCREFLLNGSFVQLGVTRAVRNEKSDFESKVGFSYMVEGQEVCYILGLGGEGQQSLNIDSIYYQRVVEGVMVDRTVVDMTTPLYNLQPESAISPALKFDRIHYISADRIGPKMHYEVSTFDSVGSRGEYAPSVLYFNRSKQMENGYREALYEILPNAEHEMSFALEDQVEFWLSKMYGKTKIETKYLEDVNLVSMKIQTEGHAEANYPTNVGFGYSYSLPIIVAGLAANNGDILIIENPEAHLHPSAQSVLGRFLAAIAHNGVQVFIETHSEHILNAFRVMIIQKAFGASDLNVLFFDDSYEKGFEQIPVNDNGEMACWPDRFFDQAEKDLILLVGI